MLLNKWSYRPAACSTAFFTWTQPVSQYNPQTQTKMYCVMCSLSIRKLFYYFIYCNKPDKHYCSYSILTFLLFFIHLTFILPRRSWDWNLFHKGSLHSFIQTNRIKYVLTYLPPRIKMSHWDLSLYLNFGHTHRLWGPHKAMILGRFLVSELKVLMYAFTYI